MSKIRLRANYTTGDLTADVTNSSSTTLETDWLAAFPAVDSGEIAAVVLDPLRTAGDPEIVHITAHTAGASSATISRGQEGSTARGHATGVTAVHCPTAYDFRDEPWLDARFYGLIPDGSTDNTTVLNTALAVASVGGTWGFPSVNYDKPLPVMLPAGVICVSGTINVPKGTGLIGQGPGSTFIKDTRTSSLTKSWTVTTVSGSRNVTVTSGTQDDDTDRGLFVTGSGIPTRAYILSSSGTTVTLSKAATASASVTLTVYTAVTMRLDGDDASSNQVDDWLLQGFQLETVNSGHDSKTGLLLRNAGNGVIDRVYVYDFGCGVKGVNWWDSSMRDSRFDWCGSRDGGSGAGKGWGALHLTASDGDTTDADALLFDHVTFENCHEHDVVIVGHGRRVNKIGFTGRTKLETAQGRGHRVLIDTADHVTFDPTCDFSVGDFDTGYSTAQDVINITDCLGFCADGVMIEQKTGLAAATVRHGIHFAGSCVTARPRGVRFSNGGGNPVITGKPIQWTGTNTVLAEWGGWTYDGSGSEPVPNSEPSDYKPGWTTWTPTLTASSSNPVLGSEGVAIGRYQIDHNGTVTGNGYLRFSDTNDPDTRSGGSGTYTISCPVTPSELLIDAGATSVKVGTVTLVEAGSTAVGSHVTGQLHVTSAGVFIIVPEVAAQVDAAYVTDLTPWAWGSEGDAIQFQFSYEAAA